MAAPLGGQTLNDRMLAARHSLAGQGLAKAVCKATTEELIGPKKKHLDCTYLWWPNILFYVLRGTDYQRAALQDCKIDLTPLCLSGIEACLVTVVLRTKEASAVYRSKMAFFKRAWQKVKVMSRPWALGFKSETIRPLKWGTLGSRTPDGSKNTSRQSFIFFLPTLMACIFRTTGSSGTQCTSF